MHVPSIPEQVVDQPNQPSMALSDIIRGIEAALEAIVLCDRDICMGDGRVH